MRAAAIVLTVSASQNFSTFSLVETRSPWLMPISSEYLLRPVLYWVELVIILCFKLTGSVAAIPQSDLLGLNEPQI